MEQHTLYFEQPGKQNTEATLQIALERAKELGITQAVVATNHGYTAETAQRIFADAGVKVIAVTNSAAYAPEGWVITREERERLEAKGIAVLTCIHSLSGDVNEALSENAPARFVRQAYYTFGQGMKVAVEVALMAADAGLLDMDREVIAVAGSNQGADTAIVLSPVYARNFPKLRIHEILAKPR